MGELLKKEQAEVANIEIITDDVFMVSTVENTSMKKGQILESDSSVNIFLRKEKLTQMEGTVEIVGGSS